MNALIVKEQQTQFTKVDMWSKQVKIKEVKNDSDYTKLIELSKSLKEKVKGLIQKRKKITGPLDTSKKEVMALFKVPIDTIETVNTDCKNEIGVWAKKVEAKQADEDKKNRDKERKEQEDLKEKARKAEQESEAARKEVERLKKREESLKTEPAKKKANAAIIEAEEREMKAQVKQEIAENTTVPKVKAKIESATKGKGVSVKKQYECKIVDKRILLEYLIKMNMLDGVSVSISSLQKLAKEQEAIPGVDIEVTNSVSVRK